MDEETKKILKLVGLEFNALNNIEEQIISREILLSDNKYDTVKIHIPELKNNYSSSFMTSLQKNADKSQKWPLLNLTRQLLSVYGYKMEPIRKADGYTLEGVKKYKRYFRIYKKEFENNNVEIKKIEFKNDDIDESITNNE
jgi:phage terminase large subunit